MIKKSMLHMHCHKGTQSYSEVREICISIMRYSASKIILVILLVESWSSKQDTTFAIEGFESCYKTKIILYSCDP